MVYDNRILADADTTQLILASCIDFRLLLDVSTTTTPVAGCSGHGWKNERKNNPKLLRF